MNEQMSSEPVDRLTRLCAAMTDALEAHPENDASIRCAVFLDDGTKGGIQLHNYDDHKDAIIDLFVHLRAIMKANGINVDLITVPNSPEGLEP